MYHISDLAKKVGLSRSTLLYYEKQGLLCGSRHVNGYRLYSDKDVQRLCMLKQLQAGGLTLKECKACLEQKVEREILERRLQQLDADITKKQQARTLLVGLLGEGSLRSWHQLTDRLAPDVHLDWLKQQGFDEKQALYLKWLSKDMNEHDRYMADFMSIYQTLERWAPGTDTDSQKALSLLPTTPHKIIDIGCGKGFSTSLLAHHTNSQIIAVDNDQNALDQLGNRLVQQGLDACVTLCCASMTELPFTSASFDLIWSEGSAYIMGVEQALKQWSPLLRENGCIVFSDLVWLTHSPSKPASEFWYQEYPDMKNIDLRLAQIEKAGLEIIAHFTLSDTAWHSYYQPLKARVEELKLTMPDSIAIADLEQEISIYEKYLGEFGYHMFVIQKTTAL